ncbi:MAG: hypothetical protein QXW39_07415 [Candidatus Bathyarchaeia archaeon]
MSLRKKREEVEQKYLGEYIAKTFKDVQKVMFQVPLGDVHHRYAAQFKLSPEWYARYAKRCDAVVITPTTVHLIETETRRPVTGLSELLVYKALLPHTPELKPYLIGREVKLHLVTWYADDDVMIEAKKNNIDYVIYYPEWLKEHLFRWGLIPESEVKK